MLKMWSTKLFANKSLADRPLATIFYILFAQKLLKKRVLIFSFANKTSASKRFQKVVLVESKNSSWFATEAFKEKQIHCVRLRCSDAPSLLWDIGHSYYYLLFSLENCFHKRKKNNRLNNIKIHLSKYFGLKSKKFWKESVIKLMEM